MPESKYSHDDVERWQEGATRFQKFSQQEEINRELKELRPEFIGPLKLLFLGEKPAIAFSPSPAILAALLREGFGVSRKFIYDVNACNAEVTKHEDLFTKFASLPQIFKHLDTEFCRDESSIDTVRAGVLLGFPRSDCEAFRQILLERKKLNEELKQLLNVNDHQLNQILIYKSNTTPQFESISGTNDLVLRKEPLHEIAPGLSSDKVSEAIEIWRSRSKSLSEGAGVNVHGMAWLRFGTSDESILKEARLETAMQMSGILNM